MEQCSPLFRPRLSVQRSFSFAGTHTTGLDCSAITSLTRWQISSGVSPCTMAETNNQSVRERCRSPS